ncbi:MAG TPA: LysR substrate-binding domain-containing protein, partial [Nitrosomonas sp.]|nr:LysR substrate-binding domain-containing protein [Nitrosomonas sp.]
LEIMLQMTALGRGVCVLPEWLADIKMRSHRLKKIKIGNFGLNQKLYLALRESDQAIPYIRKFIEIGRQSAHHR